MTHSTHKLHRLALATLCAAACSFSVAAFACAEGNHKTAGTTSSKKTPWVKLAQKHNGSGVQVRYNVPASLQAGQPSTVRLQFNAVSDAAGAVAEIKAPAGVTLTGAAGPLTLPQGRATTVALQATAAADGQYFVDVLTTQGGRTSVQSIPLQVGNAKPQLKATGKPETTPSGEKVISLPSQ
jgi:hypothetical protein